MGPGDGRSRDGAALTLGLRGITKRFGSTRALKGVSFDIERGSVHTLLGGNGSGKSTLVKILAGVHTADAGEVVFGERSLPAAELTPAKAYAEHLRFVHQNPSTFAKLSVEENLAIGHGFETRGGMIRWRSLRRHAREVLARFEIDVAPSAELGRLGPAMQTMVAIARALQDVERDSSSTLILDEPTAALPYDEVDLLLTSLRRYAEAGQTILLVTHRLEEVCEIADAATILRDGVVAGELQRAEISHERLVEAIVGGVIDQDDQRPVEVRGGRPVLRVSGLRGGAVLDASFTVHDHEIVGVAGLLGSGRSTLLRLLFGAQQIDAGEIELAGRPFRPKGPHEAMSRGVGLTPGDRTSEAAFTALTLRENISMSVLSRFARWGLIRQRMEKHEVRELIAAHDIVAANPDIPFSALSGGNQQKAVMARAMDVGKRVLLLDEPTQGVDVGARREIWAKVRAKVDSGCSALVVSSDLEELSAISDRALVMVGGRVIAELQRGEVDEATLDRYVIRERAKR